MDYIKDKKFTHINNSKQWYIILYWSHWSLNASKLKNTSTIIYFISQFSPKMYFIGRITP